MPDGKCFCLVGGIERSARTPTGLFCFWGEGWETNTDLVDGVDLEGRMIEKRIDTWGVDRKSKLISVSKSPLDTNKSPGMNLDFIFNESRKKNSLMFIVLNREDFAKCVSRVAINVTERTRFFMFGSIKVFESKTEARSTGSMDNFLEWSVLGKAWEYDK